MQNSNWTVVPKMHLRSITHYSLSAYLDLTPQQTSFIDGQIDIAWQSRFGVVTNNDRTIFNSEWGEGVMEGLRHEF